MQGRKERRKGIEEKSKKSLAIPTLFEDKTRDPEAFRKKGSKEDTENERKERCKVERNGGNE